MREASTPVFEGGPRTKWEARGGPGLLAGVRPEIQQGQHARSVSRHTA